jgi:predicted transcriptional regulator of viral defense system
MNECLLSLSQLNQSRMDFFSFAQSLDSYGLEIFSLNDVVKLTGQKKEVVISTLSRWVKQGKIFRLKKPFYSLKRIENKFLLQKLFPETYIGLYSALEYYGSTTQRFNNLDLITNKILYRQEVENVSVNFHKVRKNLFFGYTKVLFDNTDVFVSNVEKTLIDCVYFSSKVYLSETNSFISAFRDKINPDFIAMYLKKLQSPVLNKRVGYLLEKNQIKVDHLFINGKYDRLNTMLNATGQKDKKWKLIINEDF